MVIATMIRSSRDGDSSSRDGDSNNDSTSTSNSDCSKDLLARQRVDERRLQAVDVLVNVRRRVVLRKDEIPGPVLQEQLHLGHGSNGDDALREQGDARKHVREHAQDLAEPCPVAPSRVALRVGSSAHGDSH